jgi:hypothetical protein
MNIYGAGLAGLLAAHMLRRHNPTIFEAQPSLPNNHEALLRFRTDAVARATGIPFQEVEVIKAVCMDGRVLSYPDIRTNNLYSFKVTGTYRARSISDLRPAKRFIAPPNLIEQMARSVNIVYGQSLKPETIFCTDRLDKDQPLISTIPMPAILGMIGRDQDLPEFPHKGICSLWMDFDHPEMKLYQTIYYPSPRVKYYRASITGNRLIVEFVSTPAKEEWDQAIHTILHDFGINYGALQLKAEPVLKHQKYGKIIPIAESQRRSYIMMLTDCYRIYSVGRFATWRQILMDDVVQDIERVATWMTSRDTYQRRLEQ